VVTKRFIVMDMMLLFTSVGLSVEALKAREIDFRDRSTWPQAPAGLVASFRLPEHQARVGFVLSDRTVDFVAARWVWREGDRTGQITISCASTVDGARAVLFGGARLFSGYPTVLSPGGVMIGDASWAMGPSMWFCRRNVAVILQGDQEGAVSFDGLVNLARRVVKEIDSERMVSEAGAVTCPRCEIAGPGELEAGRTGAFRVSAKADGALDLTFTCRAWRNCLLVRQGEFQVTTRKGNASFEFRAAEAGDAKLLVTVVDRDGMVTQAERSVRVLPGPRIQ
jgi:hypothetical protein